MDPIKSNQLSNHFWPLDLAEIKSQPLKLIKITAIMAVQEDGSLRLSLISSSPFSPPHVAGNLQIYCLLFFLPTSQVTFIYPSSSSCTNLIYT
ncbi:hypothetical protein HanPSC8_Chr14g0632641 [Helianthus annuus]|nr:hypothetical protein HanIR_Chr14g0715541 [Helianthus annuus]KAJ0841633.1 hypothetical protein HanPSC8_Chr14g0632641 [Helianthus annuus]